MDPIGIIFFAHDTPDLLGTAKPLVGFQKFEVALWQEFRWEEKGHLSWTNYFKALGAERVTIGEALNQMSEHTTFHVTQPFFMSSNVIPGYERSANTQADLNALMRRYRHFLFNGTVPKQQVKEIPACTCCFAKWVLSTGDFCKARIALMKQTADDEADYELPCIAEVEAELERRSAAAIEKLNTCHPCKPE